MDSSVLIRHSVVSRTNAVSVIAQVAIQMPGAENATARQPTKPRAGDSSRSRIHRPVTNIVAPKSTAFSGPATARGSKTKRLVTASMAGYSGGNVVYGEPSNRANPLPDAKFLAVPM